MKLSILCFVLFAGCFLFLFFKVLSQCKDGFKQNKTTTGNKVHIPDHFKNQSNLEKNKTVGGNPLSQDISEGCRICYMTGFTAGL